MGLEKRVKTDVASNLQKNMLQNGHLSFWAFLPFLLPAPQFFTRYYEIGLLASFHRDEIKTSIFP
jgi:hypothetical protein